MAEFQLREFIDGPTHGTDRVAGWLSLIDENGVQLWTAWISPVPIEVWAEISSTAKLTQLPGRDVQVTSVCDLSGVLPARVCQCTGRAGCPNVGQTEDSDA